MTDLGLVINRDSAGSHNSCDHKCQVKGRLLLVWAVKGTLICAVTIYQILILSDFKERDKCMV